MHHKNGCTAKYGSQGHIKKACLNFVRPDNSFEVGMSEDKTKGRDVHGFSICDRTVMGSACGHLS